MHHPESALAVVQDFKVQRGTITMSAASSTISAGVDYDAPSASTTAFIRITGTHHTGAGSTGAGDTQNADDTSVSIENPSNILTSVRFVRPATASDNTRVDWEIVEFTGEAGGDNEMIIRNQQSVTYGSSALTATGTPVSGVSDDADIVVFITGQQNPDTGASNYNTGQSTSAWSASSDEPVFTRGESGSDQGVVSYAVVEFKGKNWAVQRSEHTFTLAGTTETESITSVNSLTRTFLHTQKRAGSGQNGVDEFGHEVWLSSIGQVSYLLESGASTSTGQTSVAWVIENTQTTPGAMEVTRSNGSTSGGMAPLTLSISIGKTLPDVANASIFANSKATGTGTNHPRAIGGAAIASTTHYELWRSNTGSPLSYRIEIVEWPNAGLEIEQNYYRFYVDNNSVDPADPWPAGGTDLGENTVLTSGDEPLGGNERIRIRMSLKAVDATLPAGTRAFRLQYGALTSTCSAITEGNWVTLGDSASTTLWRGYNAAGTTDGTLVGGNPPSGGELNLSVSDVSGTFEEANDTGLNTYAVSAGDDIEYDWLIEQNGAAADTYYCFRMVETDGTALSAYNHYPQLRTASFAPFTQNWRWYDDEVNETPTTTLAGENVSPSDIANQQTLKLRVTVKETENVAQTNARFKLQYSEYGDFLITEDVVATTTCSATSTWCYADGGGSDNGVISTATLSDADSCVGGTGDGCGTHNESPSVKTGFTHENAAAAEYEFTIKSAAPHVNRVYYFRLYDVVANAPVEMNTGESYPSLVTEGAQLTFTMTGLTAATVIEGVTLDITTTPTTIAFGELPPGNLIEGGHRLGIDTNGTKGYQLFMMMEGDLMTSSGATVKQITGTNASPAAWNDGCSAGAASCFGYHTGDDTLQGGSTRFSALDTYARLSTTTLDEVSYSSQPAVGDTTDIVFRILVRELQDAGLYETNIMYVSVPIF